MKYYIRVILYIIIIACPQFILAQIKKDTANFYYKLEIKANKYKLTSWIYDVVFEDFNPNDTLKPIVVFKKKTINPFIKFNGKKIRDIQIIVLDPFGYSVNEFYSNTPDCFEKLGNKYHTTTKEQVIRNLLLFKPNKVLDAIELSESERILRLSPYIFDARIYLLKSKSVNNDSIDVLVVTQDRWTTTANSGFDFAAPNILINDKNILGFGHQYTQGLAWDATDEYITTSGKYSIFNIKKSFVGATVFYSTTNENKQVGASIERLFFSTLTKWAGGLSVTKNNTIYQQIFNVSEIKKYDLVYNTLDLWGAKSFPFTQKQMSASDKRSINIVTGARYFYKQVNDRPSFAIDSDRINSNESLFLLSFGFSQRKYYRDRYLFRYGANEDIPEGNKVELIGGTLNKEGAPLFYYTGIKLGTGKHIDNFGYLSVGGGYGTFYNANTINLGVVNLNAFYFSDLIKRKKWFFRQFVRFNLIEGIARANYESLNINGPQMYGFSNPNLVNKSKVILNFEFVMYSPFKIIGFQFAPVLFYGIATLGNNITTLINNKYFHAMAIGVLIRNEYLVSNTFEISLGFYPYIFGNSDFTFIGNPISNYNVKANDYFINKPDLVLYE